MKPYYDDGRGIVIYHGDARDILPHLPQVDLVLSDPPYGISYETNRRAAGHKMRKPVANDETLDVVGEAWPQVMALLRDDRHWYAFASPRKLTLADQVFPGFKQILCWDKGDRGTVGDLECGFGEAWEAIVYGMKGRRPLNGSRPRTVLRFDWSASMDPVHPTVKPVALLQRIVNWSTDEGELVLDPFAGSGTTARACKNLGRRCISIELEERYCAIAVERLRQEVMFV